MWRFPKVYVLSAGARWSAWLLVLVLLWKTSAFVQLEANPQPLIWLSYITFYTFLWSLNLPRFLMRVREGSVVILYDLLLSALPVWFSGGWSSPFLVYMLSAIVVPAAIRSWSGGMLIAAAALAIDQVILWTTPLNPWEIATSQSVALVGRTLLPLGVAAAVVLSVEAWRLLRGYQRRSRRTPPPVRMEYPCMQPFADSGSDDAPVAYERSASVEVPLTRTWGKDRPSHPTLERRSPATIQAALRHFMPDFQAAGVSLMMQVEGDERHLPRQIHELLLKAIEITLDNVLSHARAHSAKVALSITDEAAVLCVTDDGIGLFDGTAEPPGFHQVKRLRFRAQEIGGELRVAERDEGGVEVHLRLPLVR
jgi:hypothetical protein